MVEKSYELGKSKAMIVIAFYRLISPSLSADYPKSLVRVSLFF